MRVAFAGTPQFAVPTLRALVDANVSIATVLTQPDRPAGRGRRLLASPVKRLAEKHGLTVMQPVSLKDDAVVSYLDDLAVDALVVVAYGLIIPAALLNLPACGCINVHASLLPRWRGAAPIARAIEAGDSVTGITIMKMDSGLDTGPIIAAQEIPIDKRDNAATLHDKLAEAGARLLLKVLPRYMSGKMRCVAQDHAAATYAAKITKEEARIEWARPAARIMNQVRAFNPWPVAFTFHDGERIRVLDARISSIPGSLPAGSVCAADKEGVHVACGEAVLQLTKLQRNGAKPLPAADFLNGYPINKGDRLR